MIFDDAYGIHVRIGDLYDVFFTGSTKNPSYNNQSLSHHVCNEVSRIEIIDKKAIPQAIELNKENIFKHFPSHNVSGSQKTYKLAVTDQRFTYVIKIFDETGFNVAKIHLYDKQLHASDFTFNNVGILFDKVCNRCYIRT